MSEESEAFDEQQLVLATRLFILEGYSERKAMRQAFLANMTKNKKRARKKMKKRNRKDLSKAPSPERSTFRSGDASINDEMDAAGPNETFKGDAAEATAGPIDEPAAPKARPPAKKARPAEKKARPLKASSVPPTTSARASSPTASSVPPKTTGARRPPTARPVPPTASAMPKATVPEEDRLYMQNRIPRTPDNCADVLSRNPRTP